LQREPVLLVVARLRLDEADVVEGDLSPVDRALVEDFRRNVFRRKIDALAARLLPHRGEEAHLELEGEKIDARDAALAAFDDHLLRSAPLLSDDRMSLLSPPNELVGPAAQLAAAAVEQVALNLGLRARLVDMLQRLKGQNRRAHVARLAVPDQLHLALVHEQDGAVLFWQRLALAGERDQIAPIGVGQLVEFLVATGHFSSVLVHRANHRARSPRPLTRTRFARPPSPARGEG